MPDDRDSTESALSPRRRRLMFRAWHRGTKEADLMIGGFVARNIAGFAESELDELEAVLELPDVDLADWLSGRRAIPAHVTSPMLERMALECGVTGAGVPPELRSASDDRRAAPPHEAKLRGDPGMRPAGLNRPRK